MILIDADVLLRTACHHCTEFEQCEWKDGKCGDFDMELILHAPTVCCEECEFGNRCLMQITAEEWDNGFRTDKFGCSYFYRKRDDVSQDGAKNNG